MFRNGNEVTFINLCGMVICLLGIFAHVIRKAIKADEIQEKSNRFEQLSLSSSEDDDLNFKQSRFNSLRSPILTKEGRYFVLTS